MLLCLDVGNTHILGGIFEGDELLTRFRYATHLIGTSDQFGIFLNNFMVTKNIQPSAIDAVAVSSVVPGSDYTIRHTINSYLDANIFELKAGAKTGLNIRYKNPNEVGADRIANAIAAMKAFPHSNIIIVDMGTATTLCAMTKSKDYLGGAILPGMRLSMDSLRLNTAKLMEVDIEEPAFAVGKTTRESIQSGLYYGQLGALREIIARYRVEVFQNEDVTVLATGGFSQLFRDQHIFDAILPDLVLQGLCIAYKNSLMVA